MKFIQNEQIKPFIKRLANYFETNEEDLFWFENVPERKGNVYLNHVVSYSENYCDYIIYSVIIIDTKIETKYIALIYDSEQDYTYAFATPEKFYILN